MMRPPRPGGRFRGPFRRRSDSDGGNYGPPGAEGQATDQRPQDSGPGQDRGWDEGRPMQGPSEGYGPARDRDREGGEGGPAGPPPQRNWDRESGGRPDYARGGGRGRRYPSGGGNRRFRDRPPRSRDRGGAPGFMQDSGEPEEDFMPTGPVLEMKNLQAMTVRELISRAKDVGVTVPPGARKHDLVCALVRHHLEQAGAVKVEGVLELLPEGYGFLRASRYSYVACAEDIYVSASHVRRWGLRRGSLLTGWLRPLRDREKFFGLAKVETIEGDAPEAQLDRKHFDKLTPLFPDRRVMLEGSKGDLSMRVLDLVSPIGFGQRGLIVAPPRTGKTILLQKIANAVTENNPNAYLIMLLVDERPEEVTDMLRSVKGEVISSTFDESPARHVQVTEMAMERAKRLVEMKRDVVVLIDSITRLSRGYNNLQPGGGRILSGGVESNALQKPKRLFGAARNTEEGGSLTILATALVETGSRMDDVIFEEFKGTGNLEVTLDRELAERRLFPAINLQRSGTRKEELLYHKDELPRITLLRRAMAAMLPVEGMEMLLARLRKTKTNAEFLLAMNF